MGKQDSLVSESEEETFQRSSSDEPGTPANNDGKKKEAGASEYEKQRLSRIAENRARMEALGLSKMASSLMGSAQKSRKSKGKAKITEDDDDDYRPQEEEPTSSADREENSVDDEDYLGPKSSVSNKRKAKNKVSKSNKKSPVGKISTTSEYMDEDEALKLAIALSLQVSGEPSQSSHNSNAVVNEKKGKMQSNKEDSRRNRVKKSFASRLQMTEDELLVHYYQFDDNWKGGISVKDLERVATAHDFTWTAKELTDMIRCFDSDGDGKLSLDDFRTIAVRCHMIKESQDP
ncbi:uncharacterized protein LOC133797621 [Humulus lupulus]|uniref:uncharacterized protein LOC133797621 n=1 Tax=Humulus lupulus TaxID=3486 RepID=UPI002B411201|nr:uncharacterized protein LOC133797621 [Humulus lupulus]